MQQCLTKHVARIWLFVQPDESLWQSVKSSFEASLNDRRVNSFTGLCYPSWFVKILVAYSGIMEIFLLNLVMKEEKQSLCTLDHKNCWNQILNRCTFMILLISHQYPSQIHYIKCKCLLISSMTLYVELICPWHNSD